jgi:hypothetical protein
MSSYVEGQDFVNDFSSTIRTKLSLMIISMDDVDLDGSPVVADMLLLFGGVTNPTIAASFTVGVVDVGSSLSLFAGGCTGDDITLAL